MSIPKIRGKIVNMDGRDFVVPPLNLKAFQSLEEELKTYNGKPNVEQLATAVKLAHAAMIRNYPDLTADEMADMMDLGNMAEVMDAVMGGSGLVKQTPTQLELQSTGQN